MTMTMRSRVAAIAGFVLVLAASPVVAQTCGNTGAGFQNWLQGFAVRARKQGISQKTLNRALKGVTYNRRIIRLDRSQRSFKQSFATFYKRRASAYTQEACADAAEATRTVCSPALRSATALIGPLL